MLRPYILIFLLFNLTFVSAQTVTFNKLIDIENQAEKGKTALEIDNGYCIFGTAVDFSSNQTKSLIRFIKTDELGDTLYLNSYSHSSNLSFDYVDPRSFKKISNNLFGLNAAGIRHDLGIRDYHFFIFDDSLKVKLHKSYSTSGYSNYGRDFTKTEDSGYALIGFQVFEQNLDNSSFYLIKIDSLGNKQWEKTYFSNEAVAINILNTFDGGFMIYGFRDIQFRKMVTVLKVDSSGNTVWYKNYGNQFSSDAASIVLSSDSNYVIAYGMSDGTYCSGAPGYNPVIKKIDSGGNELWEFSFQHDCFANPRNIKEVAPGEGYIVIGNMLDELIAVSGEKYLEWVPFLLRLDNDGNLMWERRYAWYSEFFERHFKSQMSSVEPTEDKGFICTGYSSESGERNADTWLLKLDSLGCLDGYCGLTDTSCYYQKYPECGKSDTLSTADIGLRNTVNIYPNPAKDEITVEFEQLRESSSFSLFNIKGERILETEIHSNISKVDVSQMPSGHYFYTIENQGKQFQKGRLVILE